MKTMKLWRIAFMMLTAFSLASCSSDDDDKDIVEQVTIFVSAETGTYNVVPDTTLEEGMLIRIDHEYYIPPTAQGSTAASGTDG